MGYKAKAKQTSGGSGSDPTKTRQWDGHVRHLEHLKQQEHARRDRRGLRQKKEQ